MGQTSFLVDFGHQRSTATRKLFAGNDIFGIVVKMTLWDQGHEPWFSVISNAVTGQARQDALIMLMKKISARDPDSIQAKSWFSKVPS